MLTLICLLNFLISEVQADPIPEGFKKATIGFVFLCDTNGQPTHAIGTCFFVRVKLQGDLAAAYLVTARHVLQTTNGNWLPQVLVRFSKTNGGVDFVTFPLNQTNSPFRVYASKEPGVDLAVVPVASTIMTSYQISALPAGLIAAEESVRSLKIREGDDMFFMGLFTPFYGSKANIPVVRFGRLSMLTDEKISADTDGPQNYYLMETQVFGGNSGSPVFFYFDERRNPNDTSILLAGVVKGYFYNYSPVKFVDASPIPYATENNGIALVTPAYKLLELLNSAELKQTRGEK